MREEAGAIRRRAGARSWSEASVRRLVCMTLASTRESGRELTRSRLADGPRAASMLAARGPAPAGHAEH
jgi:hypothetical protein